MLKSFERENDHSRGLKLAQQGRAAEALACFEEALRHHPEDAMAWNDKAHCLNVLGRSEEALSACQRAIALAPDLAAAWCTLAEVQVARGEPEQAKESYHKALGLLTESSDLAQIVLPRKPLLDTLARFDSFGDQRNSRQMKDNGMLASPRRR